ncbi:MAG: hypothetical protein M9891_13550 [Austwickia sp.]|nr:hypothetical protein [Austwickia sp.]
MPLIRSAVVTFFSPLGANQRLPVHRRIASVACVFDSVNGTIPSGTICSAGSTATTIGALQNGHANDWSAVLTVAAHRGQATTCGPVRPVGLVGEESHSS